MPLLRYLDDGLWQHTLFEFKEFMVILNNHHPQITLKHNLQQHKVEFLNTQAFFTNFKDNSKGLGTKVYFKETERHALLYKTSYHPCHMYRGLIKSQLIRFHRICTLQRGCRESEVNRLFESSREYTGNRKNKTIIPLIVATHINLHH